MAEIDLYDIYQGQIAAFLLVLTRTSGIFLISPFFGSMNVPMQLRAATAIVFAVIIFPVIVKTSIVTAPESLWIFAATVAKEMFVGWLIGFTAYVSFAAISMSGKIMDMQIGFAVANVMDPTSGQQMPLIGSFLHNLAVIYLVVVNGHHFIISGLVESFRVVPLDTFMWNENLTTLAGDLTASVLMIGMKIAMPVTFAILMTNVGLGILARTMPQMNIFVIGIPLQLTIGTATLAMLMPFYVLFLDTLFNTMYGNISTLIKTITG